MRNVPISLPQARPGRRQTGYTLTELVVVIAILALIAAAAIPSAESESEARLQLAAEQFAAAMRYARSESIRTGKPHGFRFLTNQYRIRVFSTDTSVSPWTWLWDIYDPVQKHLYDVWFPQELSGSAAPVVHTPLFRGTCNRPGSIYFDAQGTPWCFEPETVLVESYQLDFFSGSDQMRVRLDGITGRVVVQ